MAPGGIGASVVEWHTDLTSEQWVFEDVVSRREALDIIADGIVWVWGAFLTKCWDHNMKQHRF